MVIATSVATSISSVIVLVVELVDSAFITSTIASVYADALPLVAVLGVLCCRTGLREEERRLCLLCRHDGSTCPMADRNLASCTYRKSDPFKIGKWNWHLTVEKNRKLFVKLYPEASNLTRDNPPITSFIIRVICSMGDRKTLIHPEFYSQMPLTYYGSNSFILQFGGINFQREAVKRAPSAITPEASEDLMGAIFLGNEAVPVICGIRAKCSCHLWD
ncbi:BTB/POZ domain-containing protein [Camellia lanceoleosa]|uniref:BTB/POZ domain-containing protein n=1 Tax=Camellia lanceoleosa TaxID=1840588 RepID=A0ACC0GKQ3_9ERIC|nr:BTB/POZ domain-containing protein [Camellia lanceoleosa]